MRVLRNKTLWQRWRERRCRIRAARLSERMLDAVVQRLAGRFGPLFCNPDIRRITVHDIMVAWVVYAAIRKADKREEKNDA